MLCLFCLGVETLQKVLFIQRLLRSFTHEMYASQAQTKTGRCMAMQETSFQLCTKYMVTLPESLGVRGHQPSLIPSLFLLGNEPVDGATASQDGSSDYQSDALMHRATGAPAFSLIPSKKSCSSLLYKSRICLKIICMFNI